MNHFIKERDNKVINSHKAVVEWEIDLKITIIRITLKINTIIKLEIVGLKLFQVKKYWSKVN